MSHLVPSSPFNHVSHLAKLRGLTFHREAFFAMFHTGLWLLSPPPRFTMAENPLMLVRVRTAPYINCFPLPLASARRLLVFFFPPILPLASK